MPIHISINQTGKRKSIGKEILAALERLLMLIVFISDTYAALRSNLLRVIRVCCDNNSGAQSISAVHETGRKITDISD